jgi:hypothetical protein
VKATAVHTEGCFEPFFALDESGSHMTLCWREQDSNLYGAFPVKRLFWVVLTVFCSERERPFFVPSPAIRFAERAEGVKGPKR